MDITSLAYAGFIGMVLLVYRRLPSRGQNLLLLLASYGFYAAWSYSFPLLLLGLTGFNYFLGLKLSSRSGQRWLWVGVIVNLLVLIWFKHVNFYLPDILLWVSTLGMTNLLEPGAMRILLPVGLSFYLLQAIAYLVDVYRRQIEPGRNPIEFALYLAWFPKLTAGPIERPQRFMASLAQPRRWDRRLFGRGVCLILIGLVRKLVIADTLLQAVPDDIVSDPAGYPGVVLVAWLIVYAFGLYNDFAGYSDMARGVSRLFGIELTRNFAAPLFARNYGEFWNRWHITLSSWLRDYVYFPVSRALLRRNPSRFNVANLWLPPVVTMVVSGLWHGATWNLILWGILMGVYQVFERLAALHRPVLPGVQPPPWRRGVTQLLMVLSMLLAAPLFLMEVPVAVQAWRVMLQQPGWTTLVDPHFRVMLLLLPSLWIDWVQLRSGNELVFLSWPQPVRSGLAAVAALAVFLFTHGSVGEPFVYQGF